MQKYLILICFLIQSFLIHSQKIENGQYKSVYKYDSITKEVVLNVEYFEKIYFKNDSLFTYYFHDCTTDKIGEGIYKLKNHKLILNFQQLPPYSDSTSFKITNEKRESVDSIFYKFILIDGIDRTRLQDGVFAVKDSSNYVISKRFTNEEGICNFTFSKKQIPLYVNIIYLGYRLLQFPILDTLSKTVEVYELPFTVILKDKVLSYEVKNITDDGFYLLGGIWNEWTFFKKMK